MHAESLEVARKLGDKWVLAMAFFQLAYAVRVHGDYERALPLAQESIRLFEELGDRWRLSMSVRDVGIILLRKRDYNGAARFYAESLRLRDPAKNGLVAFQSLEGLACIACGRGQYQRTAVLFGAAKPIQEGLRSTRDPDYEIVVDQYVRAARTSLGEEAFASAWSQGGAMALKEAVEFALMSGEPTIPTGRGRPRARSHGDPLTAREREVVGLVARGLTNREIASTLVVSGRTADAHVQNILNKLGFGSRAQIAAWAMERGLGRDR